MKHSLCELFLYLDNQHQLLNNGEDDLFGFTGENIYKYEQVDIDFLSSYFSTGFNPSVLNKPERRLFDLSEGAFDIFIHAWLSELPVEAEMLSYCRWIIATGEKAGLEINVKRQAAETAANDRSRTDMQTILAASYKVYREIHRMQGLLRFSPDKNGLYIARCEPDHFIIPALSEYLKSRFGGTPWIVIDEKRKISLSSPATLDNIQGIKTQIQFITGKTFQDSITGEKTNDQWEELWRHYHKTINNESRNNPDLQRQFMPKRYWKYLPEK
jgi:probable DNA metabolism protein